MPLSRWMLLIAVLVGLGCLEVAQRNAVVLKGYAVGAQTERVHTQRTEVAWLNMKVTGLSSPTRLAQIAQDRRLKLVAWSMLSPVPPLASVVPLGIPRSGEDRRRAEAGAPLAHLAAVDASQSATDAGGD